MNGNFAVVETSKPLLNLNEHGQRRQSQDLFGEWNLEVAHMGARNLFQAKL